MLFCSGTLRGYCASKRILNYKIIQEGNPTYKLFLEKLINYTIMNMGSDKVAGVGNVEQKK